MIKEFQDKIQSLELERQRSSIILVKNNMKLNIASKLSADGKCVYCVVCVVQHVTCVVQDVTCVVQDVTCVVCVYIRASNYKVSIQHKLCAIFLPHVTC